MGNIVPKKKKWLQLLGRISTKEDFFTWYNNSILHCKKGCDFATGRMNDEKEREEAQNMCKSYANELYAGNIGDLDNIKDLRVHAEMFPTNGKRVYKACLAGTRRQKY